MYLVPVFARLAGFPVTELHLTHNFASCFVIFLTVQYIFLCVPHVFRFLKQMYNTLAEMIEMYGLLSFLITIWSRLFVPIQLLIFWLMLFTTQLYNHYLPSHNTAIATKPSTVFSASGNSGNTASASGGGGSSSGAGTTPTVITSNPSEMWYLVIMQSAAEVCFTPFMLAGTCVAVSYASRIILSLTRMYAAGPGAAPLPNDLVHSGWTEGAAMALLAEQTSLLDMAIPERLAVLSIILLIVVSSLVQNMYEIVEPIVLALSAQGVASVSRHCRAVSACLLLLVLSMYMVYMFTSIFEQYFWLLLVVSTSIMTSVQVVGLLATYILLTWDTVCAQPWPGLDDLVYYTRATTRVFEFIVAVFVVGAVVKESITGQWSWINAVVLLIHCYFNVWQRLQQGWKSFLLRLEAAKKISGLPEATQARLMLYNDVCAICYADMSSARITHCNHLFHGPCLRKWLYVQDKCPMCHAPITLSNTELDPPKDVTPQTDGIETEIGANIPLPDDGESGDLSL